MESFKLKLLKGNERLSAYNTFFPQLQDPSERFQKLLEACQHNDTALAKVKSNLSKKLFP